MILTNLDNLNRFRWFQVVSGCFMLLRYGAKLKVDINELRQFESFQVVSGGFRLFHVVALRI